MMLIPDPSAVVASLTLWTKLTHPNAVPHLGPITRGVESPTWRAQASLHFVLVDNLTWNMQICTYELLLYFKDHND